MSNELNLPLPDRPQPKDQPEPNPARKPAPPKPFEPPRDREPPGLGNLDPPPRTPAGQQL